MLALSLLSTLSVAAAAPTILLSQLQDVNLGRCLDNTRGAVTEGNLLQWWDCAGVDPERKGLANPNQGFRPDGKKWRYVDNDEYCLAVSKDHNVVMARCEGYYEGDILSTEWVHAGEQGRLCTQWNIDYCIVDGGYMNGILAVVTDSYGDQADIKLNEEGFESKVGK